MEGKPISGTNRRVVYEQVGDHPVLWVIAVNHGFGVDRVGANPGQLFPASAGHRLAAFERWQRCPHIASTGSQVDARAGYTDRGDQRSYRDCAQCAYGQARSSNATDTSGADSSGLPGEGGMPAAPGSTEAGLGIYQGGSCPADGVGVLLSDSWSSRTV